MTHGERRSARTRTRRPWRHLLAVAAVLVAGLAVTLAGSGLMSSPANANGAPATDCTVAEPTTTAGQVQVTTPGELLWLAQNTVSLSATIALLNDVDLAACGNWPGIGGGSSNPFTGTFDGGEHTIYNVSIAATSDNWGLFRNTDGASISNLTLNGVTVSAVNNGPEALGSLVGYAANTTISAVTVVQPTIVGYASGYGTEFGGLVGVVAGGLNAENVHVTQASITGDRLDNVGGLVGLVNATSSDTITIHQASFSGSVNGMDDSEDTGGIVGYAENYELLDISDVTVSASLISDYGPIGGVIGALYSGASNGEAIVARAHVSGTVSSNIDSAGAGGIVGELDGDGGGAFSINDVVNTATVSGDDNVGGLFGSIDTYDSAVTVSASRSSGNVNANGSNAGGLIGEANADPGSITVTDSHANGDVSGSSDVGGLIGSVTTLNGASFRAERVYASGDVSGDDYVGGLIGELYIREGGGTATISAASSSGDVTSSSGETGGLMGWAGSYGASRLVIHDVSSSALVSGVDEVGGLFGALYADGAVTVSAARFLGSVTATGDEVGGFAGYATGNNQYPASWGQMHVSQVLNLGSVVGHTLVGGLIGYIHPYGASTILVTDAYNAGGVTGSSNVGGLVGQHDTDPSGSASLLNSYAAGGVTASGTSTGGLIGTATPALTVTNSFWDTDTSGLATSAGGAGAVGKTTTDMKSLSTFDDAGWDIANSDTGTTVWGICDGQTYPFLIWQNVTSPGNCASGGGDSGTDTGGQLPPSVGELVTQPVESSTTTTVPASSTTTVPTTTVAPTDDTPPPVLIGGALPALPAGDVVVMEGAQPVAVEVFVENDTELVLQASTFELRLEGDCSGQACTIDTTPEGNQVLTLEEDGTATTQGEGFEPGSRVDVWLFSEPRYLGQVTVRADGTFEGDVNLGEINPGEHTLQVNGLSRTGAQRSANLGVIVNSQQAPTPGDGGTLPATGTSTTPIWLIAMVLLGLGLVATSRRRNTLG